MLSIQSLIEPIFIAHVPCIRSRAGHLEHKADSSPSFLEELMVRLLARGFILPSRDPVYSPVFWSWTSRSPWRPAYPHCWGHTLETVSPSVLPLLCIKLKPGGPHYTILSLLTVPLVPSHGDLKNQNLHPFAYCRLLPSLLLIRRLRVLTAPLQIPSPCLVEG